MATAPSPTRAERELVITRTFDAPRELVYRVWTDPEHLKRWQGAPQGMTVMMDHADLRASGTYRLCMHGADGTDHWLQGTYREVHPNERLVFTHCWTDALGNPGPETIVTITFADRNGKTELTLRQTGFSSDGARDGHRDGWSSTFDRMAEYVGALR